jgi:hypothetical protein
MLWRMFQLYRIIPPSPFNGPPRVRPTFFQLRNWVEGEGEGVTHFWPGVNSTKFCYTCNIAKSAQYRQPFLLTVKLYVNGWKMHIFPKSSPKLAKGVSLQFFMTVTLELKEGSELSCRFSVSMIASTIKPELTSTYIPEFWTFRI